RILSHRPRLVQILRKRDDPSRRTGKYPAAFRSVSHALAAFTRAGVKGTVRSRRPLASNTALASAAATVVVAASPAPRGGSFGRSINSIAISGTSGKGRIG